MSVIVVAEFPMTEQGAQDLIDWSKGDDGYVITCLLYTSDAADD